MPNYIDLTIALEDGMRGVATEPARELRKDGWNASTFHLYSHCGTHIDAPLHFEVNEGTIDQYPAERFFVESWLIDVSSIGDKGLIEVEHLGKVAEKIKKGEGLVFKTGWSNYLGTSRYREQLPRISLSLARWCAQQKVGLIGVEPPSIADVTNMEELTKVHEEVLRADIVIVEGLTNLDKIKQKKFTLVALPLKMKNADGAPARVVAIEK